jgi:SseB protein N-terminal domain
VWTPATYGGRVLPWTPASPFERLFAHAFRTGDIGACCVLLTRGRFALPVSAAAAAGEEPPVLPVAEVDGTTWLVAYTSVEAMQAVVGAPHCQVVTLPELAAGWPDTRWGLAVNPGLDVHLELESGTLARLAVPGVAENKEAYPDALPPVMQKVLTGQETAELMLGRRRRVSGYVHQAVDVADVKTAGELLAALGETGDVRSESGSVTVLRWTAVGSELYRSPYGGTDEATRAAVTGWVVEEPPFNGLGLGRNPDKVVREYKVDGLGLPANAELWEIGADGGEERRAALGWEPDRWWSFRARRDGAEEPVALEAWDDQVEVVFEDGTRTPAARCEQVAFVTTVGEFRGQPCLVQDRRGYELLVEYTGGRADVARELGMERVERGVHRAWVPRAALRDQREHRVPLDL